MRTSRVIKISRTLELLCCEILAARGKEITACNIGLIYAFLSLRYIFRMYQGAHQGCSESATSQTCCCCIHLFSGEDALDVNPAVRLDGAVAAAHGAYPRFVGRPRDARQEREVPQEHRAYDDTTTITPDEPVQGTERSRLGAHLATIPDRIRPYRIRSSPIDRHSHNDHSRCITATRPRAADTRAIIDRPIDRADPSRKRTSLTNTSFLRRSILRSARANEGAFPPLSIFNDRHFAARKTGVETDGLANLARAASAR